MKTRTNSKLRKKKERNRGVKCNTKYWLQQQRQWERIVRLCALIACWPFSCSEISGVLSKHLLASSWLALGLLTRARQL